MILVAVGSNISSRVGPPLATCQAAVRELAQRGVSVRAISRWYESAPVPISDQPWYVNGAVRVDTPLAPDALLTLLHEIEHDFGRVRAEINAPRTLDLDLLAHHDVVQSHARVVLPHPRLHERAFVLLPLADIAAHWRHPTLGLTPAEMLAGQGQGLEKQGIRPISDNP